MNVPLLVDVLVLSLVAAALIGYRFGVRYGRGALKRALARLSGE